MDKQASQELEEIRSTRLLGDPNSSYCAYCKANLGLKFCCENCKKNYFKIKRCAKCERTIEKGKDTFVAYDNLFCSEDCRDDHLDAMQLYGEGHNKRRTKRNKKRKGRGSKRNHKSKNKRNKKRKGRGSKRKTQKRNKR